MAFKFLLHDFDEQMLFIKFCIVWSGQIWEVRLIHACDLYSNVHRLTMAFCHGVDNCPSCVQFLRRVVSDLVFC